MLIASSLTHNRMSLNPPHSGLYEIISSMKGIKSNEETAIIFMNFIINKLIKL